MALETKATFNDVPYTKSTRGHHHKINCPDCGATIHTDPDAVRSRRSCRACKAKWLIQGRPASEFTTESAYTLRRLAKGKMTPVTGQVENTTQLSDILQQMSEKFEANFATELDTMKSTAFTALIKDVREQATKIAQAEAAKVSPIVRKLVANVSKPVVIKGERHYAYDELLETITAIGKAYLVGPAGSGKTTLCRQVAEDLELDFGFLACTEGLSEAHILGRMAVDGSYIPSDFVRIFEEGGVFLFDEIDAMDGNVALVINEAIENGFLSIPNRPEAPIAVRHDDTIILAAANTFGTGADATYVGRNQLDGAFLDRFSCCQIEIGYDKNREATIASSYGIGPLAEVIWKVREAAIVAKVRRPVTTRWILNAGKLRALNPKKYTYGALLAKLMVAWTDQEKAKVLANLDLSCLSQ